jgi:hypothetical protein
MSNIQKQMDIDLHVDQNDPMKTKQTGGKRDKMSGSENNGKKLEHFGAFNS